MFYDFQHFIDVRTAQDTCEQVVLIELRFHDDGYMINTFYFFQYLCKRNIAEYQLSPPPSGSVCHMPLFFDGQCPTLLIKNTLLIRRQNNILPSLESQETDATFFQRQFCRSIRGTSTKIKRSTQNRNLQSFCRNRKGTGRIFRHTKIAFSIKLYLTFVRIVIGKIIRKTRTGIQCHLCTVRQRDSHLLTLTSRSHKIFLRKNGILLIQVNGSDHKKRKKDSCRYTKYLPIKGHDTFCREESFIYPFLQFTQTMYVCRRVFYRLPRFTQRVFQTVVTYRIDFLPQTPQFIRSQAVISIFLFQIIHFVHNALVKTIILLQRTISEKSIHNI